MVVCRRFLLSCAALVILSLGHIPGVALAEVPSDWTAPQKPFHIAGNLYYVGSRDLAAYLIVTPAGDILLNANLATSSPQIRSSVRALGYHWRDIKILLLSQPHYDHAAGAAQVLRETGAKLMVMAGDAEVVEAGDAHDFGGRELLPYTPAHVTRVLHDGDTIALGGTVLTAHKTAGHSSGCTTWTLDVPLNGQPRHVVIVGGYAALSSYRLVATPTQPASYPGIAQDFEHTFAELRALPCDIFLGAHGSYFGMQQKLARLSIEGSKVWIDPAGYRQMIAEAEKQFKTKLAAQQATALRQPSRR
uniref:Beta-lactamase-like n=1 Tax=mine drainage metagenome TaxID=410659 RepID=E6PZ19_9ZZZZ